MSWGASTCFSLATVDTSALPSVPAFSHLAFLIYIAQTPLRRQPETATLPLIRLGARVKTSQRYVGTCGRLGWLPGEFTLQGFNYRRVVKCVRLFHGIGFAFESVLVEGDRRPDIVNLQHTSGAIQNRIERTRGQDDVEQTYLGFLRQQRPAFAQGRQRTSEKLVSISGRARDALGVPGLTAGRESPPPGSGVLDIASRSG